MALVGESKTGSQMLSPIRTSDDSIAKRRDEFGHRSPTAWLTMWLPKLEESGIVYTLTRRNA
jgi:hypothetical protein